MTSPAQFTITLLLATALPNSDLKLGQARAWAPPGHRPTPARGRHAALLGGAR